MSHCPRIRVEGELAEGQEIELPDRCRHHLAKVLRRRAGDALILWNGDDCEFAATLSRCDTRSCRAEVGAGSSVCREAGLRIELVQGVARGDRMDFVIQKSVELGACAIQPVLCERGGVGQDLRRSESRLTHWRGVALSAAEQSGRTRLPPVHPPLRLGDWLDRFSGRGYALDPAAQRQLPRSLASGERLSVLIGPESGLSERELEHARARGLDGVRLGPRTLRTETAAAAVLASLHTLSGEF